MAEESNSFQSYLDAFTKGTLSLINSKNQIETALNTGTGSGMTNSRQDAPVPKTPAVPAWLILGVGLFVLVKVVK